jgi:predicted glutamine amidotransferase
MKFSLINIHLLLSTLIVINLSAQEAGFNTGSLVNARNFAESLNDTAHNCRFWGMIAGDSFNESTKALHLNSLKHLAPSNPNGWGFGFYAETQRGGFIPVLYRGMWRADQDILFDLKSRDMLENLSGCAVAHVRNSSSGYVNIPNPHPFYTRSLQRDFSMLFAHNGTLDKPTLIEMLGNYTDANHYSYSGEGIDDPNLDSDLYRLYLMKWIDEYPTKSISTCLADALVNLTTEMGTDLAYNFVMASNYDTLWALRYNYSLYYRREVEPIGYVWEVASQPFSDTGWVKATNHYLYAFSPGMATPDSILVKESHGLPESTNENSAISFEFPNPTSGSSINIDIKANEKHMVSFRLYGSQGQILSETPKTIVHPGRSQYIFNIGYLNDGFYYLNLVAGENSQSKKLVIVNGR